MSEKHRWYVAIYFMGGALMASSAMMNIAIRHNWLGAIGNSFLALYMFYSGTRFVGKGE